jgi:hypothetical protein
MSRDIPVQHADRLLRGLRRRIRTTLRQFIVHPFLCRHVLSPKCLQLIVIVIVGTGHARVFVDLQHLTNHHTWVNREMWWNDTDRGKPNDSEKNQPQCHFVHHKFHTYFPGFEPGSPRWNAGDLTAWATARPVSLLLGVCAQLSFHKPNDRTC